MKSIKISSILILPLLMIGCVASSRHLIQSSYNLNGFRYVLIAPITYEDGFTDKYGLGMRLAELFAKEGVQVLSEYELDGLPKDNLLQVLVCEVQHFHTPDALGGSYATVIIDLYDMTRRKVFKGEGKYQGLSIQADLDGALKRAFEGFAKNYSGFKASLAIEPAEEIRKKYGSWETINLSEDQLRDYFDKNIEKLDLIEGIWTESEDNMYRIGIFKDTTTARRDFVAIILQSRNPYWQSGEVKIEFQRTAYKSAYSATYYMQDHSTQGTTAFMDESGLLNFKLKDPEGKRFETYFVKNYPTNMNGKFSGRMGSAQDKSELRGSGLLLTESGLVASNYHVVKEDSDIEVLFPQIDKAFKSKVVLKDAKNDLVVLKLTDFDFSKDFDDVIPYAIAHSASIEVGQEVFTLGFPLGDILGKSAKLSTGTINSLYGIQDDPRLLLISNPVQPGNSGGPLFNRDGMLVGIVFASLDAKYFYERADIIPQNVNFAIKSEYLTNIVSLLPESDELRNRRGRLAGRNLEEQVKLLAPFVVAIKSQK